MKWIPSLSGDQGFTLIEIMITLVILSISLIALAGMQVSAIRGNAYSKRLTTAVAIAEQAIEQLKSGTYAAIQSQSAAQVTQSGLNFTRQVTVTDNSPMNNTKTVAVILQWKDGSKTFTVPVSTVISGP
jgi:type IV pilus assembly protein PilV